MRLAHRPRSGCRRRRHRPRRRTSASAIAQAISTAFGRDVVKQYLAAVDRCDKARKAVAEAGLGDVVEVFVSGIDAPREAVIALGVDPAEAEGYETIPRRFRRALAPFRLDLDFPSGDVAAESGDRDGIVDARLRGGGGTGGSGQTSNLTVPSSVARMNSTTQRGPPEPSHAHRESIPPRHDSAPAHAPLLCTPARLMSVLVSAMKVETCSDSYAPGCQQLP